MNIRPETYFVAEEQAKYDRACEEADRRHERVEQRAKELMQPGESCYPWRWENLSEALANTKDSNMKVLSVYLAEAVERNLDSHLTNHLALCGLRKVVEDYWWDIALHEAEKEESYV